MRYGSGPSVEHLKEALSYDPKTGEFRRRTKRCFGRLAGATDSRGHIQIRVGRPLYLAHRLAWLYIHGTWPLVEIDHKNGIKTDNRISNLRLATRSQNQHNASRRRDNTSGHKGVMWDCVHKTWLASISKDGRRIHRSCKSKEEAIEVRKRLARELHGEFARHA